jgi:hypothetical protein
MTPPESLTESERASVELTISVLSKSSGAYPALAKLLRIHDRLQGEVEMLRVQQGRYAMAIERLEAEVREMKAALELPFRPVRLHQGLDLLLAQFLADPGNVAKLPSNTTVMELLIWSHARARKP